MQPAAWRSMRDTDEEPDLKFMNTKNLALATAMTALFSGNLAAGGLVELPGDFDGNSNNITNPWWPQPAGQTLVYLEEADDECVVGVVQVIATANQSRATVDGVKVREIWDREYIDHSPETCDGNLGDSGDWELVESTFDWYAQDVDGNVWYYGERSVATDHDECDHETDGVDPIIGLEGCLDGSWEAGYDIWEEQADDDILAGIIMLTSPAKGDFYFQEYWEDEATDMGKVLNFKQIETVLFGDQEGCVNIKEWVPLDPGNVEHKYYCYEHGLVLVEGNAGGKTVWTDLVNVIEP